MKKNVPILTTQLYLSLFLHIITGLLVAARDSPPIYTPVEDITVKCGYSGNLLNECDERYWHGDINSNFSPTTGSDTSMFREAPHSYTIHRVSYTTARLSRSEFTYSFKLTSGQKFIRLYFNPVSYGPDFDRSKALFSVKASGFTLLHDFNTSVTADAYGIETIYREFCLNMESSEQSLNITFTPSPSLVSTGGASACPGCPLLLKFLAPPLLVSPDAYAFINGIEIVSMPTNLYFTAAQSLGVGLVGNNFNFHIENNSALETVYRINVGGKSLFFSEDTGMYRNWGGEQEEPKYLDDLSIEFSVLPQNSSIELNFTEIAKYSAPEELYHTGRSMGWNKSYNLTWNLPVDPKFYYLVRLHFCKFEPNIVNSRDRNFLIYIANDLAEEGADIIMWSGGNGRPVHRDYLVFVTGLAASESWKKVNLSIALRAHPDDSMTNYNDAILNGLEIFKLNDTSGNLAGHNPNPPPMSTPKKALPPSPERTNTELTRNPMLAIIAGVVSTVTIVMFLGLILVFRQQQKLKADR